MLKRKMNSTVFKNARSIPKAIIIIFLIIESFMANAQQIRTGESKIRKGRYSNYSRIFKDKDTYHMYFRRLGQTIIIDKKGELI
jgi:hypothetical protein